jgi:hypothetical protein
MATQGIRPATQLLMNRLRAQRVAEFEAFLGKEAVRLGCSELCVSACYKGLNSLDEKMGCLD